ncbi:hypothetical protein [Ectobacillus ponti]|uniref:Uncharacterized protein n=1 Tax=Ectobacillus ponti TaxID=2961894 RepID=A0AA41XDI9_9BACI|nr:hypothetical protein [Ectobacillus ponti]MCP8970905.1 hypothetical protein [Ectobacillus ponti]
METIRLQYIVEGTLDDKRKTEFANGLESSYDLDKFRENPMETHQEGTKETLKSIAMYYMCNIAEVQRVVVRMNGERYIDLTRPMLSYIKEQDLLSFNNLL